MSYAAPSGRQLAVRSRVAERLAPGHRQLVTVTSADGRLRAERMTDAQSPADDDEEEAAEDADDDAEEDAADELETIRKSDEQEAERQRLTEARQEPPKQLIVEQEPAPVPVASQPAPSPVAQPAPQFTWQKAPRK